MRNCPAAPSNAAAPFCADRKKIPPMANFHKQRCQCYPIAVSMFLFFVRLVEKMSRDHPIRIFLFFLDHRHQREIILARILVPFLSQKISSDIEKKKTNKRRHGRR